MAIRISDEARERLSPEELESLESAISDFEAQAAEPKNPNGMPRDKTDFPIGIYDFELEVKPNYDNPLK